MTLDYISEFRDGALARQLAARIAREADPRRSYRFMEFCGGHTHAIFRYGVQQLMPPNVIFIHGPGCPVCVLPGERIEQALTLAAQAEVTLCTYGDLLRVPASDGRTLLSAKAQGADIRMIYSTQEVVRIAAAESSRQVVFFAIGFETTTPPTAIAIQAARAQQLDNFSVFCNHVLTPPALRAMLATDGPALDGILGPSHVSTLIGTAPYAFAPHEFGVPVVIAGFEPLDVMQATLMLIRQINADVRTVENQYARAVDTAGNPRAQALMREVFRVRERFAWRGLGELPASALALAPHYAEHDAEQRFILPTIEAAEPPGCACSEILRGRRQPEECRLFANACTPEHPIGACMVSSEGACAAHWHYAPRTHRNRRTTAA